jgi:hypothetical protein
MEAQKPKTQAESKRVFEAAKRAVELSRISGMPIEAAISDTAMQSGIPATEIARMIEIMLDALAARRMVDAHGKAGA